MFCLSAAVQGLWRRMYVCGLSPAILFKNVMRFCNPLAWKDNKTSFSQLSCHLQHVLPV